MLLILQNNQESCQNISKVQSSKKITKTKSFRRMTKIFHKLLKNLMLQTLSGMMSRQFQQKMEIRSQLLKIQKTSRIQQLWSLQGMVTSLRLASKKKPLVPQKISARKGEIHPNKVYSRNSSYAENLVKNEHQRL